MRERSPKRFDCFGGRPRAALFGTVRNGPSPPLPFPRPPPARKWAEECARASMRREGAPSSPRCGRRLPRLIGGPDIHTGALAQAQTRTQRHTQTHARTHARTHRHTHSYTRPTQARPPDSDLAPGHPITARAVHCAGTLALRVGRPTFAARAAQAAARPGAITIPGSAGPAGTRQSRCKCKCHRQPAAAAYSILIAGRTHKESRHRRALL